MKTKIIITITTFLFLLMVVFIWEFVRELRSPYELNKRELTEFTKRAENGDSVAARCLSHHYEYLQDYDRMFYWLRRSAAYNNAESKFDLYQFLPNLKSNDPEAQKEAFNNLVQAAALNHTLAQLELASLYFKGEYFKKDLTLAERWATEAAESGDVGAMELIPKILIEKDYNRSDLVDAYKWTIIALSRINLKSSTADSLRTQQIIILQQPTFNIGTSPDEIKAEAAKLALSENQKIPKEPDIAKAASKELYETCHP